MIFRFKYDSIFYFYFLSRVENIIEGYMPLPLTLRYIPIMVINDLNYSNYYEKLKHIYIIWVSINECSKMGGGEREGKAERSLNCLRRGSEVDKYKGREERFYFL